MRPPHLQSLVGVHDDGDEDAENDVDEQADEDVQVDAAVPPDHHVHVVDRRKRREDVVAVHQTEETLGRRRHVPELQNNREISHSQPTETYRL